jgi:2',3'-cyclic-nucleotide 2'-phosphodiesterase (5'-nucleotidase family)
VPAGYKDSFITVRKITIFHTADMHNRHAAFPLLRSNRNREAALFLDSGDAIGGSNTLFFPAERILAEMDEVGYAAMAMGNREFHYLRSVISMRAKSVKFPFLAANIVDRTGMVSHCWKDFCVISLMDLKIGVTGLSPVQFSRDSLLARLSGFTFIPPGEALAETLEKMKREKVDLTILLSHLGLDDDLELAESTGVDLILGGHSHSFLPKPLSVAGTYVIHSGFYGSHVGHAELTFEERSLTSLTYEALHTGEDLTITRN